MCVCLYVCLYVYVCIYTYTRIHIPSKIYTQIRRTHEICRWEPFKTPLIGPAAHPCLSAAEAASIFRTILREPYQGKNVMGRAGVEQGRGGEVEAAGPGVRTPGGRGLSVCVCVYFTCVCIHATTCVRTHTVLLTPYTPTHSNAQTWATERWISGSTGGRWSCLLCVWACVYAWVCLQLVCAAC